MRLFFSLLLICSFLTPLSARTLEGQQASDLAPGSELVRISERTGLIQYIRFNPESAPSAADLLYHQPWMPAFANHLSYQPLGTYDDQLGMRHHRYQVIQDGIPVEGSMLILHEKNGRILSLNGDFFPVKGQASAPVWTESMAFQEAVSAVDARTYRWNGQNNRPTGELYYAPVKGQFQADKFRLTWRFDIYASKPLSREWIYVDATSGEVIYRRNRIHNVDAPGTAITKYSGTLPLIADLVGANSYRLRETGRGGGIVTLNMQTSSDVSTAVDFTDSDNIWDNVNAAQDEVAGDCHVGTEVTFDYFFNGYGWNSFDNQGSQLVSYVHYGSQFDNAFWDGTAMTYGDGGGGTFSSPLTTPDVCGHELTHGVTEFSAGLIYAGESGGLNESFSDIFGTVIEYTMRPTNWGWLVGEDCTPGGVGIRSMEDPPIHGNPDTYLGTNWSGGSGTSAGGVHTNSGVQNKWFFLLSDGESGTNDNGDAYTVSGIGIDKAAQIAFRNLSVYLTPASEYADARFYALESARDLFGNCNNEYIQTANAWHGVGVGQPFSNIPVADFSAYPDEYCNAPAIVSFSNLSSVADTYLWDFGDGNTSTDPFPIHTYQSLGSYTVSLTITSCTGATDTKTINNIVVVDTSLACDVVMNPSGVQTLADCEGKLLDPGGYSDYPNGAYTTVTIAPPSADFIDVVVNSFDTESGWDFLEVFDGASTAATSLGSYSGTQIPSSFSSSGPALTFVFSSDGSVTGPGFDLDWVCQSITTAPQVDFVAGPDFTCSGIVSFTDNSTLYPSSWAWDFGDGNTSTQQNPLHTYTNSGVYSVTLIACNSIGCDTLVRYNDIIVNLGGDCDTTSLPTSGTVLETACQGSISDDGGPFGTYSNGVNTFYEIVPPNATDLVLTFTQFAMEDGWDYLTIYDGPTSAAPVIGVYSGLTLPNNGTIQATNGALTLHFQSDGSVTYDGFVANWQSQGATNGPAAAFTAPDTAYLNMPVSITDQSAGGTYYNWNLGDGTNASSGSVTHTYNALGTYEISLELTDSTGCSSIVTDSIVIVLFVGQPEPNAQNLQVWPNPSTGVLNISYTFPGTQTLDLEVVNLLGQPVHQEQIRALRSIERSLDLSEVTKGMYFVRMRSEKGTLVRKILIE